MIEVLTKAGRFQFAELDPDMDQEFIKLYKHLADQQPYNLDDFHQAAFNFLDKARGNTTLHDEFFQRFAPLSRAHLHNEHWHRAEELWGMAVEPAVAWEDQNPGEFIHKGTPFYFQGMTAIIRGELDVGYPLMHQALQEDIRTHRTQTPRTPAFAFAILDYDNVLQAFRQWSQFLAQFLDGFLMTYRTSRNRSLQLSAFRDRFLVNPPSWDVVFLFAYTLGRFALLNRVPSYALQSDFSSQLETNLLFDLILVVDALIRARNPTQRDFSMHAVFLSSRAGLSLTQNKLQEQVNRGFNNDPEVALAHLLNGTFAFRDGTTPTSIEADLAIAYGLRNYGAHNVASLQIVRERFPDIRQGLFNVLFLAVEVLY